MSRTVAPGLYDELDLLFCSPEHVAAYFGENRLPAPAEPRKESAADRLWHYVGCTGVLLLLLLIPVGAVTVVRWMV